MYIMSDLKSSEETNCGFGNIVRTYIYMYIMRDHVRILFRD